MNVYDISREMRAAPLYPGGTLPVLETVASMKRGDPYNSTILHAGSHTATHCDAFSHFVDGELDIASMPMEHYAGPCRVIAAPENALLGPDFFAAHLRESDRRVLIKGGGRTYLTAKAAEYLTASNLITLGTDAWSVAPLDDEAGVHIPLLAAHIAIVEQLDLADVPEGEYFLCCPPIKMSLAEGAPCRAVLLEF